MSIGLAIGTHLGRVGGAGNAIAYLLGPFFRPGVTPDHAAPLPSPYTETGAVGSLTLTDTNNESSVSGGQLHHVLGVNGSRVDGPATTRATGRALLVTRTWGTLVNYEPAGWVNPAGGGGSGSGYSNAVLIAGPGATPTQVGLGFSTNNYSTMNVGTLVNGTTYQWAVVLRSTGGFVFINGGTYTAWTLLYVVNADSTASIQAFSERSTSNVTEASFRVTDLGGAFATDYGIATNRLVSPAANTDSTSAADAVTEINFTYNGTPLYFQYRRQDASNTWEIDAASGTLTLYEVNGGTYTSRGSSASTFAPSTAYRIVVVYAGTSHTVYVNNLQKFAVTSASFQTQTAIRLDAGASGGVSSIVAWPRTVILPNV